MQRLKTIAFFLFACVAIYLALFFTLTRVNYGPYPAIFRVSDGLNLKGGNTFQKFQEFNPEEYHDVIFLGSSHAYRGYDPRLFQQAGYSAFNLGTSSQTLLNSYYLCEEYLNSENTGLLILDIFAGAFELNGLESTADLTQNVPSGRAAFGMAWAMRDPRAFNMLTLRTMLADHEPFYLDSAYVGLGFSENDESAAEDIHYLKGRKDPVDERQWKHFERLLEHCNALSIPVVLVDHPAPMETMGKKRSPLFDRLVNISKEHGVPFLDFKYHHSLNSHTHFYDHTHLNTAGVMVFNPHLISELEELGLLKIP